MRAYGVRGAWTTKTGKNRHGRDNCRAAHSQNLGVIRHRGAMIAGIGTNIGGSGNRDLYLLRVGTFSFPQIDCCRYVIVFMARGHLKVRETSIWIQSAIDLLVRPAGSVAAIYVVSEDMFKSVLCPTSKNADLRGHPLIVYPIR